MNEEIIRLREELVGLSSDPMKTRELLDKLEGEVLWENHLESPIHIGKKDIKDEKDFDFYKVSRTADGQYLLHYKGGYTVLVDEKLLTTCSALELLMEEKGSDEEELAKSAIETIFRLPLYVFSHPETTYTIATIATKYLLYLQEKGDVPTEDTDNPEYDKFIQQMNELMENFAAGLEKEGLEYERRNGITHNEEKEKTETKVVDIRESDGKGEGENTEA